MSSVTSRRLRSNHNSAAAATSAAPASAAKAAIGQTPAPTDVWMARVRSTTKGRCDPNRTETSSASSRASMPPSPATRPKLVGMRGGPSAHHDNAGASSVPQASASISPSARSTVTPSRSGASHHPAASPTPEVRMSIANVAGSASTTGGGGSRSGPSSARSPVWTHQKSSNVVPAMSR